MKSGVSKRPEEADSQPEFGPWLPQASILIVDDERDVADMVSIGLERLGYEVGVCADGTEALEVFRETLN